MAMPLSHTGHRGEEQWKGSSSDSFPMTWTLQLSGELAAFGFSIRGKQISGCGDELKYY